jgi:hypothetical protein
VAQLNTSDDIATRKRMLFRLPGQLLLALGPGGDESRPETERLALILYASTSARLMTCRLEIWRVKLCGWI